MSSKLSLAIAGGICASVFLSTQVWAGVSPEEASKLKSTLTPLGGEKAGNADGTIPAWTGGLVDPNYKTDNGRRDNLFKDDKPLFSIKAANVAQYRDKLSDATVAMLNKYPDSYRVDVYKTVRSAAAPQYVYDNTFLNATRGEIVEGPAGPMPKNVFGGKPFPIVKSGVEAIWNHLLAWRGYAYGADFRGYLVTAAGEHVMGVDCADCSQMWQYYDPKGTIESFEKSDELYQGIHLINKGPPIRAGEQTLIRRSLNSDRDETWIYLTGQRRVRRLPNACCDTPTPATAGVMSFDELFVFSGRMSRFNWTIVGKKELYVPYNSNQSLAPKTDEGVMSAHFVNPDYTRWELHRVLVVDAVLAPGQRHVAPKGRYYFDEDTGFALLADRYDGNGALWKMLYQMPFAAPDIPALAGLGFGFYDLNSGTAYINGLFNAKQVQYPIVDGFPASTFSPEAMAGVGIR